MVSPSDTPVLVAPRPVRLNVNGFYGRTQPIRLVSAPDIQDRPDSFGLFVDAPSDNKDITRSASPRASPRATLPSEALEEFLSILRPSFFPPRSPVRSRRQASLPGLPTIHQGHERSFSYKGPRSRSRLDMRPSPSDLVTQTSFEEAEVVRSTQSSRSSNMNRTPESVGDVDGTGLNDFQLLDLDEAPFRWFATNILSSPISRTHTRNPFQRHATYPLSSTPGLPAPPMSPISSVSPLTISPAAIPLPLPTPDELEMP